MNGRIQNRAWLYEPLARRRRAALLVKINQLVDCNYAVSQKAVYVNEKFATGVITFEEKALLYTAMYGIALSQQLILEEALRQSHASLLLEGFCLENEILLLNERVLIGEISMDKKLELIKHFYA